MTKEEQILLDKHCIDELDKINFVDMSSSALVDILQEISSILAIRHALIQRCDINVDYKNKRTDKDIDKIKNVIVMLHEIAFR
jgi:hypothetical protein